MKLAVSTYSLSRLRREQNKTLPDVLRLIADAGVKGVEITAHGPDDFAKAAQPEQAATEARKECEKVGLTPIGYCTGAELLKTESELREVIAQVKRGVDVAAALGVRSMRHDVTRGFSKEWKGPQSFDAALKVVVPAIREIADYAAGKKVRTSLENHGFYMQESARVAKLIKTVKHANFGLTMDMGNFLCVNEDPLKAVQKVVKLAQHVHTKDFHVRPKKTVPPSGWFATPTPIALRGAIVGHGVIDIPGQLKVLKKAGYKGWLSLEFEGMEDPVTAVKLGLEYLRVQLKEIGALDE